MEKIKKPELVTIFTSIAATMEEAKEELIHLDGSMGDGDLGLTMCSGFHAVEEEVRKLEEADLGKLLMKLGMKMNSTVPSTMGTLVATCFLKAAPKAKGKMELSLQDMVEMGKGAVQGVMDRGKTKLGEKTMLDALAPAVEALEKAASEGKDMGTAWSEAAQAAEAGVEKTKAMQSVHGRAAYYREQSIGKQDPGATAMMYIIRGIAKAVR